MAWKSIFKRKSLYIILAIVLLGGLYIWNRQQSASAITYETADVVQGDLLQTVEVTGDIKPAARIDLSFKSSGTLSRVNVKIGDQVKQGDVLAELEIQDLDFAYKRASAAVSIAQANLNARLAGESAESIRVAQAGLDQAKAAYDKAVSDLDNTKIQVQNDLDSASVALSTAQNNLANTGPVSDQTLSNAIESARSSLRSTLGPMTTALTDGDAITGVDDTASNQMYKQNLGAYFAGALDTARASYMRAKTAKLAAQTMVEALTSNSSRQDVLDTASKVQDAIESVQSYLLDIKKVLSNSSISTYLTSTDLSTKKATIDADYSSVSTQKSTVVGVGQSLDLAILNNVSDRSKLEDALKAAQVSHDIAETSVKMKISAAESAVAIQKAAMDASQASLDLKKASPRAVDVAALRAQLQDAQVSLAQAESNLNNARIFAPVEGTITDVISDIGEQVVANAAQLRMIGTSQYDIEAQVPETDISKVVIGQKAEITLDAYGDDVKFEGVVTAENPDQTKIQDAIYYNIRVTIDPNGKDIKPGMTANVTVTTGEADSALIIPLRSIKTEDDGTKTVRTLVDNQPQTIKVELGLKGDEGKIQVTSGVKQGDKVILSEKTGS
ncbi:MAG: efflux RND transporter periplasmic adaptor subunit [Patescibacteria group bacterium]|jgi:HlyD family secretion protein